MSDTHRALDRSIVTRALQARGPVDPDEAYRIAEEIVASVVALPGPDLAKKQAEIDALTQMLDRQIKLKPTTVFIS